MNYAKDELYMKAQPVIFLPNLKGDVNMADVGRP